MRIARAVVAAALTIGAVSSRSHCFTSGEAGGQTVHEQVTRDALAGTISDANLSFICKAVNSQDAPGSEGATEPRRHFEGGNFSAALSYIDREKRTALNYAAEADADAGNRAQALRHFGLMLHTVQDFYSKTNYVELQLENPAYRSDPYSIELVEWARVPAGYSGRKSGCQLQEVTDTKLDSPANEAGKRVVGGTTYFKVARELALKETQRQWAAFETLVRGRCHGRAEAIIAALKQASPAEGAAADAAPELDD